MGLRVTSGRDDRWWLRIGLRAAAFHLPALVPVLFFIGAAAAPGVVYTANTPTSGWSWNAPPEALAALLLTVLLFSIARRGNGWLGLHEWLSGTRVVERNVTRPVASATPKTVPVDGDPGLLSLRHIGPYTVHTIVGETGSGRLFAGVDPILRRHVWIHEVPPGTPPVSTTRRDASRPGRLHWLAGRRAATENWDAFEAPRGEPFLATSPTSDWGRARRALASLAAELGASGDDARQAQFSLAQVWSRPDGQLVLLDFPWPAAVAPDASQALTPVALLAAVSTRAVAPTSKPSAPLSATVLLDRLASGTPPALADVNLELRRLSSVPDGPSRLRRALPIVLAATPVAVPILAVTVLLPAFMSSADGRSTELVMWMS